MKHITKVQTTASYNLGFLIEFTRGIVERVGTGYISAEQGLDEIEKQIKLIENRYVP